MLNTSRFDAVLPSSLPFVNIVGCGGIGAYTALGLAKMGFNRFSLYDPDTVEDVNVATQLFGYEHIGMHKPYALLQILERVNPACGRNSIVYTRSIADEACLFYNAIDSLGNPDTLSRTVVIAATDSIESRQDAFDKTVMHHNTAHTNGCLFIDPRMAFEHLEVNLVIVGRNPADSALQPYTDRLFDKSATYVSEPCGARAISTTGMFAAAVIASSILRYVNGMPIPHTVLGDIGRCEMKRFYRDGETYVPFGTVAPDASGVR